MRYLAIDYWTKKIGLAYSVEWIAFPNSIIATQEAITKIAKIVKEQEITDFVIGIPNHITWEESDLTRLVRNFSHTLTKNFPDIKIHEYDERLSTVEAILSLENIGYKKKYREKIDDIAAAIILQSFLDSRKFF